MFISSEWTERREISEVTWPRVRKVNVLKIVAEMDDRTWGYMGHRSGHWDEPQVESWKAAKK